MSYWKWDILFRFLEGCAVFVVCLTKAAVILNVIEWRLDVSSPCRGTDGESMDSVGGQGESNTGFEMLVENATCQSSTHSGIVHGPFLSFASCRCRTSMKEMPTLQTSAWIPYCSPDILSGCGAKRTRPPIRAQLSTDTDTDETAHRATYRHVRVCSHVGFSDGIDQLQEDVSDTESDPKERTPIRVSPELHSR